MSPPWFDHYHFFLKEKLPQAFMQIGLLENDFRNPTAKVWSNLHNPIKKYYFSKVSLLLGISRNLHAFMNELDQQDY